MATLPTAFICETDILIGKLIDDSYEPDAITKYGYKNVASAIDSYGGISNAIIKTGGTPSDAYIFSFDVGTAVLSDANEGVELVLLEDNDVAATRAIPFEEIYVNLGASGPVFEEPLVVDVDSYKFATESSNQAFRVWCRDNLNNTPHVQLKCYPPEA